MVSLVHLVVNTLYYISHFIQICWGVVVGVRATLPPSTLFADRVLLHREYSISEPNTLVETVSKYKGLH